MITRTRQRKLVLGYFLSDKVTGDTLQITANIESDLMVMLFSTKEKASSYNIKLGDKYVIKPCYELVAELIENSYEESSSEKAPSDFDLEHRSYYYEVRPDIVNYSYTTDIQYRYASTFEEANSYRLAQSNPSAFLIFKKRSSPGSETEELISVYYEIVHYSGRPTCAEHPLKRYDSFEEAEKVRLSYGTPSAFYIQPKRRTPFMVVCTKIGNLTYDNGYGDCYIFDTYSEAQEFLDRHNFVDYKVVSQLDFSRYSKVKVL